jgi:trigger factor
MAVVEKDGDEILAEHESIEYELLLPEEESTTEAETDSEEEIAAEEDEAVADDEAEETGEDKFQPDLTTPLLGLKTGDEKTFSITYPEGYEDEKYAGKEITFDVKVSSVKVKELDPLDDEFAQAVSDFETLAELKADIEKRLRETRELEANRALGQSLLDKIIEEAETVDWPQVLEEEMIDNEVERFNSEFERSGFNLDTYLQVQKQSKEDFREELRENVIIGLKRSVVMAELSKLEKVNVSNSEILERTKSIADAFGGGDQIWQYLLASDVQQNRIANEMLSEKIMLRLAAIAKGEAPEPGAEVEPEAEEEPTAELEGEVNPEASDTAEIKAETAEVSSEEAQTETPEQETVAST